HRAHPYLPSFPTRRSSDLVNDVLGSGEIKFVASRNGIETRRRATLSVRPPVPYTTDVRSGNFKKGSADIQIARQINLNISAAFLDRKSTRLNSSHVAISYA